MRKLMDRFGKKTVYASAIAFSLLLAGVTIYFANVQGSELSLVKDTQVIELGASPFDVELKDVFKDYEKLLKDKKIGKVIGTLENNEKKKISSEEITKENILPVGKYTMNYEIDVKEKKPKKFLVTYKVEDTTNPTFVDFKDKIEVEVNSITDIATLFKTKDLSEVTIAIEDVDKKAPLDQSKEGDYKIKVVAVDKYKNEVKKECLVKVIAKEVEAPAEQPNTNTEVNTPVANANGNTSAGNASNGGSTQAPSNPAPATPNVCVPNGQFGAIGNSGKVFYSVNEMHAWALDYIMSEANNWVYSDYTFWTVYDNCGERNDVYTVNFY